jgi:hypothetical protein
MVETQGLCVNTVYAKTLALDSWHETQICILHFAFDSSVVPIFLPANVEVKVKYSFHMSFAMEDRHKYAESHYCISMFSSNRQAVVNFMRQISDINNCG